MTLPDPAAWPVEGTALDNPTGVLAAESRDVLRERASATPDATAIVDSETGRTWTYAEFDRRVEAWAGWLTTLVDDPSGRIGIALPTGVDFATAYFATTRSGRAAVPLNRRASEQTLARQAEQATVRAVLCASETEQLARAVAPDGATVFSADEADLAHEGRFDLDSDTDVTAHTASLDTEHLVLFTSGTTGDPKGVRLTRGNLLASAVGSAKRLGVEAGDRWLVCLPMYHMGGLAPLVRSTLYGTTTVLQSGFDDRATAAVIEEHGVTGVSLVPTNLKRLLDAGWTPPESLRFVLLGGAPARAELLERCERHGVPVYPTYGTTETASQITTATPAEAFDEPGTVGRPIDGTTVSVLDDGVECPHGEVGELVVSGPTVTPGYLDAEQTATAFDERGFHTGDVGYRDEAGRYFVVGRVDDRIVTGGENVQPASVVRALESLPSVEAAAVVGIPDEEWGQRVAAAVVPANGNVRSEAVVDAVREKLADFAVPKTVTLVDALPRTASGTIDRERVREIVADGEPD